ncbi:HD-GYP domain-containing protein [Vibrio paucivorans]|uniref:HD-GYP domain-containing protein n=1 Tax=Vibrio paucivorans TaxID=2829489 RepID=A0A9X3CEM9_9VIBR|nr:HD-GYP domain-containing protein [Vibrio paucivorans]MCW8334306.1 HD-GYP domain-containing protein [Vibrio paucivorans]
MQFNVEDSIKLSIHNLEIGMFVTGIEDNKRVNLANAGRVSNQKAVNQLIDNGVKFAWVDVSLSAAGCKFVPVAEEESEQSEQEHGITAGSSSVPSSTDVVRKPKSYSRDNHQKKAKKLITEARSLAQKLMNMTFSGKVIEVDIIEDWADDMIESVLIDPDALQCVSALRKKDAYLLEHSVNVACLLVTFGRFLGMEKETLKQMAIGGIIHDVGKIKVDDKVLHKPGKLTPEEFEHMKLHQVYAEAIIENVNGLSQVSRDVCLTHHEKLDGNGYPLGLTAEQMPVHGRMSGIVDIYDALTADRCYKKGMNSAEAFKIILSLTPFHLDKDLVYKFINCIGVYPVGSLVELNDGRVGIVWSSNEKESLKPEVKCFYSNKFKRFTDVAFVNLKSGGAKIAKAISPNSLSFDPAPFYEV